MHYSIESPSFTVTVDSLGAQLISLKDAQGLEYIWQRDPNFWSNCAPVLFPIVGGLKNGETVIDGKIYRMARHGFAKESVFSLKEKKNGFMSFVLCSNDHTRCQYPYEFELTVSFTLLQDGLSVHYQVYNQDKRDILFGIGAHPGINCPLLAEEEFSDYELQFEYPESVKSPTYTEDGVIQYAVTKDLLNGKQVLPLDYSLFDKDAIILEGLKSRKISLISRKSGKGVCCTFPDYHTIAFWTPAKKHAPFICFEPWFGMGARDDEPSGALSDKKGIICLPAGEEFSATYALHII